MILINGLQETFWSFPGGERGVRIDRVSPYTTSVVVRCDFRGSDDLIDLLLVKDALDAIDYWENGNPKMILDIPYFPYARQDRRGCEGESHSMKVIAKLINGCNFDIVQVVDPHSDVVEALVERVKIRTQSEIFRWMWGVKLKRLISEIDVLVAPDAGAAKKIYKIDSKIPVIIAQKERELSTGKITRTFVSDADLALIQGKRVWIVDDICDGGKTFIELSKALTGAKTLNLYTTHGIYSKGKQVLTDIFDEVLCYNDMSVNKEVIR